MQRLSLSALVERLERFDGSNIDLASVQPIVGDGALDEATLRPYIGTRADHYARRHVHRGRWFDVMVLTWAPGQCTPVHNHAGNLGWVRLVRGQIREETFRLVPGASLPNADVAADPGSKGGCVGLAPTGDAVITTLGAVATADRARAIHRLGNPADGKDVTVTLHVYSLPHDCCLAFDLERRTCTRRDLRFDPPPA